MHLYDVVKLSSTFLFVFFYHFWLLSANITCLVELLSLTNFQFPFSFLCTVIIYYCKSWIIYWYQFLKHSTSLRSRTFKFKVKYHTCFHLHHRTYLVWRQMTLELVIRHLRSIKKKWYMVINRLSGESIIQFEKRICLF